MDKQGRRIVNEKMLLVKKSKLPGAGKGLFTRQSIPKGGLVIEYRGYVTTWKQAQENENFNGYLFYVTRNFVIDAKHDMRVLGRYANDAKGITRIPGIRNNAEYTTIAKKVFIRALRNIAAGEEILVAYGKEYWDVIKHNRKIELSEKKSPSKNPVFRVDNCK